MAFRHMGRTNSNNWIDKFDDITFCGDDQSPVITQSITMASYRSHSYDLEFETEMLQTDLAR